MAPLAADDEPFPPLAPPSVTELTEEAAEEQAALKEAKSLNVVSYRSWSEILVYIAVFAAAEAAERGDLQEAVEKASAAIALGLGAWIAGEGNISGCHAAISANSLYPGSWAARLSFGAMSLGVWSLLLAVSAWPFPCNGQSCLLQYKSDTETTYQTHEAQMKLPGWHGIGRADLPVAGTTGWFYVRTSGNVVGTHNYDHQSRHNYFACFNVSGIFVDETATDPSKSNGNDAYYDQLYAYVKSKDPSAEVMCNPGTGFDYGSWKHCCDRAMVVEVSLSSFTSGFKDPSPFTGPTPYPPGFAVVLVYGVPGVAEMQQVVRRAACSNFTDADGIWVLEEDGNGVLPGYTTMPSYFAQQVDFVKTAIAPECPPPPAPPVYTQAPTGGSCWFNPNDLNCEICYPGYNQCSWQGCYKHQCSPSGGSACTNSCSST
ncbi:hypothetical protein AK812_SmicGene34460 [Symbiodinium microadriaticum]|uniref:Uncharacterized protein n=1 Tax=Symbiodinium microadriaticum TaxID=2951 RepID=A0A1Q9CP04_SYMMI|nr:hypothetical protein AK812_SmicGene34460 [Symbiodinium microadriaticum]